MRKALRKRQAFQHKGNSIQLLIFSTTFNYRTLCNINYYSSDYNLYFVSLSLKNIWSYIENQFVRNNIQYGVKLSSHFVISDSNFVCLLLRRLGYQTIMLRYVRNYSDHQHSGMLPYFPHPGMMLESNDLLQNDERFRSETVRICFLGSTKPAEYDQLFLLKAFGVPGRLSIIDWMSKVGCHFSAESGVNVRKLDQVILTFSMNGVLAFQYYKEELLRSDFFIGCPGSIMPVTHSVIESMLAGCIPVLPDYRWLGNDFPKEISERFAFRSQAEFYSVLNVIRSLSRSEIETFRLSVTKFISNYLSFDLLSHLEIMVMDESRHKLSKYNSF